HVDQTTAHAYPGQRHQLCVSKASTDLGRFGERGVRCRAVACEDGAQCNRVAQVSLLDALEPGLIEESLRAINPTSSPSQITPVQQAERQPERATRRSCHLSEPDALHVCARPRRDALLAPTDQARGDSKPLRVLQPEV